MFRVKVQEISQPFTVVIVSVNGDISLLQNCVELSRNIFWNGLHLVTTSALVPSFVLPHLVVYATVDYRQRHYSKKISVPSIPGIRIWRGGVLVSTKGSTIKRKGANFIPPLPFFRKWRGGFRPVNHLLVRKNIHAPTSSLYKAVEHILYSGGVIVQHAHGLHFNLWTWVTLLLT